MINVEAQIENIRHMVIKMTYAIQELTSRINEIADGIEQQNKITQRQADHIVTDLLLPYQDAEDVTT